jgi:hypothetical protein
MDTRATIGVMPPAALLQRPRLFSALEALFDVRFEPRGRERADGLDAVIAFDGLADRHDSQVPVLCYAESDERPPEAAASFVTFGRSQPIDARLRGRQLSESGLTTIRTRLPEGEPLAWDDGGPVWVVDDRTGTETALVAPRELGLEEPLRDRLSARRFLELLPLVHLLRRATAYDDWSRPPPRAAFVFDDPNLHWTSYGYIRFPDLARHARAHGYHAAMAIIPLDCWYAHPSAARQFRPGEPLSLTMHGNDHVFHELGQRLEAPDAVPLFEQAIRRVSRLERSAGIRVDRIMVPPHESCSDEMMESMLGPGIEAVCRAPTWWREWAPDRIRTSRWTMGDVSPSGAPVLGRHKLGDPRSRDEVLLNVYLDQPAILYGHHVDVANGYDVLASAAEHLSSVEGLTWAPLAQIARANTSARSEGDVLRVRLYSRAAGVDVPPGTRALRVELPFYERHPSDRLVHDGSEYETAPENGVVVATVPVDAGATRAALRVVRRATPARARSGVAPKAVARRASRELRDRMHPALRRVGLERALRRLEVVYVARMTKREREQASKDGRSRG